jgi:6-pyruvoyltetrahydropterin/6-carboxytetrahydropterin synthase
VDFGSLKSFKGWLEDTFDHKTLVAEDDPEYDTFVELDRKGLIQMVTVPATGCEAFSKMIFEAAEVWLQDNGYSPRAWIRSVEIKEHGGNSAIYSL